MDDWNIGFKEVETILCQRFWDISQDDHHSLIFSSNGIWESKPTQTVRAGLKHRPSYFFNFSIFMVLMYGNISAKEFAFQLVDQKEILVRDN